MQMETIIIHSIYENKWDMELVTSGMSFFLIFCLFAYFEGVERVQFALLRVFSFFVIFIYLLTLFGYFSVIGVFKRIFLSVLYFWKNLFEFLSD